MAIPSDLRSQTGSNKEEASGLRFQSLVEFNVRDPEEIELEDDAADEAIFDAEEVA